MVIVSEAGDLGKSSFSASSIVPSGTFQGYRTNPLASNAPWSFQFLKSDLVPEKFTFESFQTQSIYTNVYI